MQNISIEEAIEQIVKRDPRYPRDAYHFIRESLDFTIKQFKKDATGAERHVSAHELLDGIRLYALQQFGPLARTVLNYWNLYQCEDIGEVVYNMVNTRILKTTEKDSRNDFQGGYNFEETFCKPFEPICKAPRGASSPSTKLGSASSTI